MSIGFLVEELPSQVDMILDLFEGLMEEGKTEDEAAVVIGERFPDHMELLRALIPPIGEGEGANPQDGIS